MRKNNAIDLDSREIPHSLSLAPCCPTRTFWSGQEGAVRNRYFSGVMCWAKTTQLEISRWHQNHDRCRHAVVTPQHTTPQSHDGRVRRPTILFFPAQTSNGSHLTVNGQLPQTCCTSLRTNIHTWCNRTFQQNQVTMLPSGLAD
jgi:hypothetical protein